MTASGIKSRLKAKRKRLAAAERAWNDAWFAFVESIYAVGRARKDVWAVEAQLALYNASKRREKAK